MSATASPPVARHAALRDFARCARESVRLARAHQLASPREHVGARVHFTDGSTSLVFRETRRLGVSTAEPVILLIRFRLAFLGSSPLLHAAFRRECILHLPLFAGFPGFRSKLWLDDVETGIYRGLYEWDGEASAEAYARRMVGLLAPFSTRGSTGHHLIAGVDRGEFLAGVPAPTN